MLSRLVLSILLLSSYGFAGDLSPALQARFLKIILQSSGLPLQVASGDADLAPELQKAGISIEGSAKVAWAKSGGEVKKYKGAGKLVVCSSTDLLGDGGGVAAVEEGGKPVIYLHRANIQASGITLGDAILKLGKPI